MIFSHFNASVGNPVNEHTKNIDTKKSNAKHQSWENHHDISTYDCISTGRCSTALPAAYSFIKHWPALWLRHTTRWNPAGHCSSGNASRRASWPSVVKDSAASESRWMHIQSMRAPLLSTKLVCGSNESWINSTPIRAPACWGTSCKIKHTSTRSRSILKPVVWRPSFQSADSDSAINFMKINQASVRALLNMFLTGFSPAIFLTLECGTSNVELWELWLVFLLKARENHLLVKQDFDRLLVNDLRVGNDKSYRVHIASEGWRCFITDSATPTQTYGWISTNLSRNAHVIFHPQIKQTSYFNPHFSLSYCENDILIEKNPYKSVNLVLF